MKLIDADALKEALNFVYDCAYIDSKSKEGIVSDIIDEIDNAPTVDAPTADAVQYTLGYQDGFLEGKKICERPQGDLADEVWKLYKKHQSHLATYVLEFGCELKDLLGKYQKGGAE